jgi:hypothetical protein
LYTDQFEEFIYGICPVMTIFYPYAPANNSSVDSPEVHLNYMKTVGSTAGEVGGGGNSTGGASETDYGSMMAITGALFVTLLLL